MEEQSRKQLVQQRAIAKSSLTRLSKYISEFQRESDIQLVIVRLKELPNIRDKFEGAQTQLELFEGIEKHAAERETFESAYFDLEAAMNIQINRDNEQKADGSITPPHSQSSTRNAIRLPTLQLPSYDGNVTGFKHFMDTFDSLVVNNDQLDNIQKFHYLLSTLKGEAHKLIANIPVSSSNFEVALQTIRSRYDNIRLIVTAHLGYLLNLPVAHKDSVNELRALINQTMSNLNAIKALNLEVPLEDLLISQLILEKVHVSIRKEFEDTVDSEILPTLEDLIKFLEGKCKALDIVNSSNPLRPSSSSDSKSKEPSNRKSTPHAQQTYVTTTIKCVYCNAPHALARCRDFKQVPTLERRDFVKRSNLCFNCLHAQHRVAQCKAGNCQTCRKKHHTLLHVDVSQHSSNVDKSENVSNQNLTQVQHGASSYCTLKIEPRQSILLSTALVKVKDAQGIWQTCRALLDSGSQSCFISESCAQRLRLRRSHDRKPIQGIGNTTSETKHSVSVQIGSRINDFVTSVECLVLPKLTEDLPSEYIDSKEWNLPKNLPFADPKFNEPGHIDLLLGAEVCPYIQLAGNLRKTKDYPILQETKLGWVLAGKYTDSSKPLHGPRRPVVSYFVRSAGSIQQQLQKFWEIEELHHAPRTKEERDCEAHFKRHVSRNSSGRFVVRLPFKENPENLGDSKLMATRRFHQLERKLAKHQGLKEEYIRFLQEYEDLGHMDIAEDTTARCYYMPHHAVVKASSSTTKTRVVFDCSAASSNGVSLNDLLLVGPTIQQDLYSIILRFRSHAIAFTADIAKMYRQILVHPQDCRYQRIIWREKLTDPAKEYELKTVTYGMSCAPFLAIRCIQQLAIEEAHAFPKAQKSMMEDFYVDDCISGCATFEEALQVQQELIHILQKGGFSLRKWCSNHPGILENVSPELRETQLPLQLDKGEVKTLGLVWHPAADQFQVISGFKPKPYPHGFTKRLVLSIVSSIFDPLGLISPIVILCKIFLQKLWQERLSWDQPLSEELAATWTSLYNQLPWIDEIYIDRRILGDSSVTIQLHGFCDSSEVAFGGCLYVHSTNKDGTTSVKLLCSKSRVAPLKKLSLPRLELCGALLLSQLLQKVVKALNLTFANIFLWTDSTIVLAWLSAPSSRWKTFVANRVAEIQEITEGATWRHVSSQFNPADLISRGVHPKDLRDNKLWWNGPDWLSRDSKHWPTLDNLPEQQEPPEQKIKPACYLMTSPEDGLVTRFSSLSRLQRVVAYIFRFVRNCSKLKTKRATGPLSLKELQNALTTCIRQAQVSTYHMEIKQLESDQEVHCKSHLRSLHPGLDNNGMLRVGGRLERSNLPYEQKHPVILPPHHHITRLIIEHEHSRLLHAGCQLLLASLRQKYWIVNGRTTVRRIIHNCLTCFRLRAKSSTQLMGQLPRVRVELVRPFLNCGIDYAGPFLVKTGSLRSKTKDKCYVALFVCLATKAVHLEVVSSLTTRAFMAALSRFISRRGRCQTIYSDHGTNFVGAKKELQELLNSEETRTEVQNFTSKEGIEWSFIPPRAPHFGGLWEAGVKSFKHHLRRVMGTLCPTFEELTTLTCQIEACLNSRPLIPLSSDPNDLEVLTPGHFLIGTALSSLPQPDLSNVKLSLLSRWEILQQQLQIFWSRWSNEYLHHLQQRAKWSSSSPSVTPGTLVIVKEDNLPPLHWKVAVIEQVHPGDDGLVRVVTIRTAKGLFKRPVVNLCPLPEASAV